MSLVSKVETRPIQSQADIVLVRQAVRGWAIEAGFGLVDQTKVITAASELARNTLDYGKGGTLKLERLSDGIKQGIRLTFEDHGPGIADLKLALTDGYTTGGGLGMGLSGARRLVSEFDIESQPGQGTRVTIVKWK